MKKIHFLFFAILVIALNSCQKDEISVTLKQQGVLKVKLIDNEGKPIKDAKTRLYYSSSYFYDEKISDNNGSVNFGELLIGHYFITLKNVVVNDQKYNLTKLVQITSGMDAPIEINPQEYTGTINFLIKSNNTSQNGIVPNINVCLIPYSDFSYYLTHNAKIEKAVANKKTDESGKVSFQSISCDTEFCVYCYFDENHSYTVSSGQYLVEKGEESSYTINIPKNYIYDIVGDINLKFYYYNNNYDKVYIPDLNVVMVKEYDYFNHSLYYETLSTILNYKVKSGITNSEGKVSFPNTLANTNYQCFVYFDSDYKYWIYSDINVGDGQTYNAEFQVDKNALGISN